MSKSGQRAPWQGVELAALLSRDTTNKFTGSAVQLKWSITPSQDKGCNVGAAFWRSSDWRIWPAPAASPCRASA